MWKYLDQKDDSLAGRTPRLGGDGLTRRDLANRFLTAKQRLVDSGDIVQRTFQDCYDVCERTIRFFGANRLVDDLSAEDFDQFRANIAKTHGPVTLGNDTALSGDSMPGSASGGNVAGYPKNANVIPAAYRPR